MKNANTTQVGGTHYAGEYQHWDFVHETGMDYFQAQFSRYVSRARKKNGVQDFEKSLHYAQKAHELGIYNNLLITSRMGNERRFDHFVQSAQLNSPEARAIWEVMNGRWLAAAEYANAALAEYIKEEPPEGGSV